MNVEVASCVDLLKSTETLILQERKVISNDLVKSYPISDDVKIIVSLKRPKKRNEMQFILRKNRQLPVLIMRLLSTACN